MRGKPTMNEQYPMIQNIVKFFGWIAAITAGVSALLSVSGFMLLQSHAHLLGVSRVFHHSVEDYLYQGGNFFITTLFWALPVSIIGNMYIWFAAGIIALYLLGKRFTWFDDITQRLHTQEALQQAWVRWVAILAAAILFLLFINHIIPPSNAQDLLFAARHHLEVVKRATPQETEMLKNQYPLSMLYVILSALILWFITRIHHDPEKKSSAALLYVYDRLTGKTSEQQVTEKTSKPQIDLFSALGRLFLYLLFLVQLVLLPVQYGKTVYPNTFHRVSNLILDQNLQGQIPQSQNIYLLNERGDELVLYFGDTQEVSLVKKGNILNIVLKSRENIFR